MLAELPDPKKLVAFDRNRHVMLTMAENVERATWQQLAELVQLLVERVQAKGRTVEPETIEWTPPPARSSSLLRCYGALPDGRRGARCKIPDSLAWYAMGNAGASGRLAKVDYPTKERYALGSQT